MKQINYNYTQLDEGYEIDWREMPYLNRLKIICCLIFNFKFVIMGEHENHYANEVLSDGE